MDNRVYCDCGNPLNYIVDLIAPSVAFAITKKGRVSENPIGGRLSRIAMRHDGLGFLECHCGNRYEYDYSAVEHRVLRGERV